MYNSFSFIKILQSTLKLTNSLQRVRKYYYIYIHAHIFMRRQMKMVSDIMLKLRNILTPTDVKFNAMLASIQTYFTFSIKK